MSIDAIQVRSVTHVVPPSSMTPFGTVYVFFVIVILISSAKWFTAMDRERVTCRSWDIKLRNEQSDICSSKRFLALEQVITFWVFVFVVWKAQIYNSSESGKTVPLTRDWLKANERREKVLPAITFLNVIDFFFGIFYFMFILIYYFYITNTSFQYYITIPHRLKKKHNYKHIT